MNGPSLKTLMLLTFYSIPLFYNIQTRILNSIPFISLLNPFHSFNDRSIPFFYKLSNGPLIKMVQYSRNFVGVEKKSNNSFIYNHNSHPSEGTENVK